MCPVLSQVLSAVVTFLDGVNTELGVMRGQLGRLEAACKQPSAEFGAPVFASDGEYRPFLAARENVSGVVGWLRLPHCLVPHYQIHFSCVFGVLCILELQPISRQVASSSSFSFILLVVPLTAN